MAFSLTSYNISQFTIDITALESYSATFHLRSYLNQSLQFEFSFLYDSVSAYSFSASLNGESISNFFESDFFRITPSFSDGVLVLVLNYSPNFYLSYSSTHFKVEQTLVLPVSDNGSGDGSTLVDSSSRMPSLNGNGSRYRDGSIVKVTTMMDEFKVAWSGLVRTDANIYTIYYDLLRKMPNCEYSELHCVPESLVYLEAEVQPSFGAD